ncbi:hypothetical protein [Planctomonas psychrotolerans]|uniref:hypothetical protein n=1 Tax=Planctomonas psychrotolerans TaxID=2528712 RepID=UPI001238C3AE|nr:hypothetical protein [Planctomonas psychrotolerans]
MTQNEDPSLGDVIRSVHATGEDRFGVEHERNTRDHPRPETSPVGGEESPDANPADATSSDEAPDSGS